MRAEDIEIIEEAVRNSDKGADFDEMLLRATKKHLPRKYHKHVSVILEEIISEADDKGLTNRQAAVSLLRMARGLPGAIPSIPPPEPEHVAKPQPAAAKGTVQVAVSAPPQTPMVQSYPLQKHDTKPSGPASSFEKGLEDEIDAEIERAKKVATVKPRSAGEEKGTEEALEIREAGEEKLPEVDNILDLSGSHPEELPPEMREKLKKVVRVQKKQVPPEEEGDEELDPHVWFRGSRPAVPLAPPKEPEEGEEEEPKSAVPVKKVSKVPKAAFPREDDGAQAPPRLVKKVKKVQ